MDMMLEKLSAYGADIEGAMGRFLDDTDLYKTCFATFLKDESFEKLGESLDKKDYKAAFDYAHTLKGVIGNMGITPLYILLSDIVDALRKNDYDVISPYYAEVLVELEKLNQII